MKVLFIASGNNTNFEIIPFIKRQAESLEKYNCNIDFFLIRGKGIKGYLSNIFRLRKFLQGKSFDILHAHYTYNGLVALLTFTKTPIVVSYMGTDTYGEYKQNGRRKPLSYFNVFISKIIQPFVKAIIVKSPNLEKYIFQKNKLHLVPNGIDIKHFTNKKKEVARNKLSLPHDSIIVLFLGDINNKRKNFPLVQKAISLLDKNITLLTPYPVEPQLVIDYYMATDVLALSSFNEGSPNVIKEAMACNKPIVSTNVGDIEWLVQDVNGCFLAEFSPEDFAKKLLLAISYAQSKKETNGRDKILNLGLDSETIAKKIILIYQKVLKN